MVAVKAGDAERIVRTADLAVHPVVLVYGPDAGSVSERARALAERAVDDSNDPFQLIRLEGDVVAADPGRLADEAGTMALFGGRRCLWLRPTSRNLAPSVTAVLEAGAPATSVIIEAGDLARSSPLRALCERSPRALAIPCYADSQRDLGSLVDTMAAAAGLTMARDVRAYLVDNLGANRLASRGEIDKLIAYVHGRGTITVADIDAIVSDVSSILPDAATDAAFAGQRAAVDDVCSRLGASGAAPATVLSAALRHALSLLAARVDVEAGRSAAAAVEAWPRLHFSRKQTAERHLGLWSSESLREAIARLQAAILQTRRFPTLAAASTARILLEIAASARRSGRS